MSKRYTIRDVYEESSDTPHVDYSTYRGVVMRFNELLMEKAIYNGEGVKLPQSLGVIRVKKKKTNPKKRVIDFHKTKKFGVTVYHTNLHSEGYYGFFNWNKDHPYGIFRFKQIYKFFPTRTNKRKLAKTIKEENTIILYTI
jgi:hypothetical protein